MFVKLFIHKINYWKQGLYVVLTNLFGHEIIPLDSGIVVREFVLQSRYYVHFQANTLGKGMNSLILPAMG